MERMGFISRHSKSREGRFDRNDWRDDEPLTIAEAVRLLFPDGPLGEKSLRLAHARGHLGRRASPASF